VKNLSATASDLTSSNFTLSGILNGGNGDRNSVPVSTANRTPAQQADMPPLTLTASIPDEHRKPYFVVLVKHRTAP
jgi:hypothetical protein